MSAVLIVVRIVVFVLVVSVFLIFVCVLFSYCINKVYYIRPQERCR